MLVKSPVQYNFLFILSGFEDFFFVVVVVVVAFDSDVVTRSARKETFEGHKQQDTAEVVGQNPPSHGPKTPSAEIHRSLGAPLYTACPLPAG